MDALEAASNKAGMTFRSQNREDKRLVQECNCSHPRK
jgi:hypothetical protein